MQTKIILEFCANHNGEFQKAIEMVDEAVSLGVWGVKLQKRNIDAIPAELLDREVFGENFFGKTYREHKEHLEFDLNEVLEIKNYAESKGLEFICTPFDLKSLEGLEAIDCKWIKLASQYYRNTSIHNKVVSLKKKKGIKIIVSNGMQTLLETTSNTWLSDADVLMYCVSIYPANAFECKIHTISMLKTKRDGIGYSSHDVQGRAIKHAVLLGAEYIERHYTLDKSLPGHEHGRSSDFSEMRRIIDEIKEVESMSGIKDTLSEKEYKERVKYDWCRKLSK